MLFLYTIFSDGEWTQKNLGNGVGKTYNLQLIYDILFPSFYTYDKTKKILRTMINFAYKLKSGLYKLYPYDNNETLLYYPKFILTAYKTNYTSLPAEFKKKIKTLMLLYDNKTQLSRLPSQLMRRLLTFL